MTKGDRTLETKRLFDINAYDTEFEGTVIACEKMDGGFLIELDQTLFFPEEGGQSPDKGELDGYKVLDVQIDKAGRITHFLEEELSVGKRVAGRIDWKHRFNNMQQHSGEHIFSGTVNRLYGFNNVGFHLSDQIVTMDFDGVLSEEDVEKVEHLVNEVIVSNLPIQVIYPTKDELEQLEYRSKIEIEGQVRIVSIEGVDVCACCAPHVKHTGEIGMLKVMSVQSYKGGVRISILCGFRALEAFKEKAKVITDLSGVLTTGQDKLVESVTKLKNQTMTLNNQLMGAKQKLLSISLESIPQDQRDVFLFEGELEDAVIRTGVNTLVEKHEGVCGIFSGNEKDGYKFIVGSKNVDCRQIAGKLREELQARGGGSPAMIQGFAAATKDQILKVLQSDINF